MNDAPANASLAAGAFVALATWLPEIRDAMSIVASIFAIVGICYSIAYYRSHKKPK